MPPRITALTLVVAALGLTSCADDEPASLPGTTAPISRRTTTTGTATTVAPPPTSVATEAAVALELVAEVDAPTAMVARPGSGELVVTERAGRVVRLVDGAAEPVIDLTDEVASVAGEQGLLGLAFSPAGDTLYVSYTDGDDDGASVIAAYAMSGEDADPASRREILRLAQPASNHNGGNIAFGPDGYLWIGFGDGGNQGDPDGNAQNDAVLLGKVLRIDVEASGDAPYAVPADNPFVGDATKRSEIWLSGVRNPWRFSFDRVTGDLWIGDVGGSEWEEVDLLRAPERGRGANLGWDAREGAHDTGESATAVSGDMVDPIDEYGHDEGSSITGGFVYRGTAIPDLAGAYLYSDAGSAFVRAIVQVDGRLDRRIDVQVSGPGPELAAVVSFAEDADGELYLLELGGRILRLTPG